MDFLLSALQAYPVKNYDTGDHVLSQGENTGHLYFLIDGAVEVVKDEVVVAKVNERGAIFGLSQFSNHKKTTHTYAGPMFMAFRKRVWEQLGRPDLKSSSAYDAAEGMSALAREQGVPLVLHKPTSTLISKFALGNEGVFGIGTFYGDNDFFHLFESREPAYEQLLVAVADDAIAQRPLQFAQYLEAAIALQQGTPLVKKKRRWWRRLLG